LWRCGSFSLALQAGLDPDVLLLGKALGGGVMPLSAALVTEELGATFEQTPFIHSQTFSDHPLSCAAGRATLRAVTVAKARYSTVENWVGHVCEMIASKTPLVRATESVGLIGGLTFDSEVSARRFIITALRNGLHLAPCHGDGSVVRLLAPLCLTEFEMCEATDRLCQLASEMVS
jgi:putrescine aminotransferase